ncbi:MAG TPA: hypothetical protein VJ577_01285, partial [Burkholderiaceae bacterium]|nr:hypothetical protein [Burkholderiaceae bacterium]
IYDLKKLKVAKPRGWNSFHDFAGLKEDRLLLCEEKTKKFTLPHGFCSRRSRRTQSYARAERH